MWRMKAADALQLRHCCEASAAAAPGTAISAAHLQVHPNSGALLPDLTQVKAEAAAAGKLLPPQHSATVSVRRIGERIAAQAADPAGGGRTDHMKVPCYFMSWNYANVI